MIDVDIFKENSVGNGEGEFASRDRANVPQSVFYVEPVEQRGP